MTINEISEKLGKLYPDQNVKRETIRLQTIFHCVNHSGRKNDSSRRWEKNPLFFNDGRDGFRLLSENERIKYRI